MTYTVHILPNVKYRYILPLNLGQFLLCTTTNIIFACFFLNTSIYISDYENIEKDDSLITGYTIYYLYIISVLMYIYIYLYDVTDKILYRYYNLYQ